MCPRRQPAAGGDLLFFAFRIMVGIGLILLAVAFIGNALRAGGSLYRNDLYLRACEWVAPLGFVAVLAGWVTTEVGRQPWTVYGLLRTADSVSPSLTTTDVAMSFAGYIAAYLIMFPAGIWLMAGIVRRGAQAPEADSPVASGRPGSPIEALPSGRAEGGGSR